MRGTRRLGRAAALGASAGLMLGGLVLLGVAFRTLMGGPDCGGLTDQECGLEATISRELAVRQTLAGGALALLGLSVAMWVRRA